MTAKIITLDNVTVTYHRHPAVHHLSGAFYQGSLTSIVGPNGAGKSTLLQAIMGMLPVQSGAIQHAVKPHEIAYLPQQADIDRSFPITVLDTVCLGHWQRVGLWAAISKKQHEQALAALEAVGLADFARRTIGSLSAGQFQRVLFARMMLQACKVILLDEPFTAIDARTTADLLNVLHQWHQEQRTIIAVVHDLEQVREHFPQTLLLAREAIAWGQTAEVLTLANLKQARRMAERWDEQAQYCERVAA